VIKLGALGDFIQALGAMAAIRKAHPAAIITLLTTKPYVSLGKACGYFDHVEIDKKPRWRNPGGWLCLRRQLIKGQYSRVYDLQNSDRTALYLYLFPKSKRPEWVGAAPGASDRNASPLRTSGTAFAGHVQTLALAGVENVTIDDLTWAKADLSRFALAAPYVLLVPGCSPGHPEKRWPAENYAALAVWLVKKGTQPVVLGTKAEAAEAEAICTACPDAVNLTGQTALLDLPALARGAAAAIGNDTGPMHMIGPAGCPALVLFSSHGNPEKHAPLGANVQVLQQANLSDLAPETVQETLSRLLGSDQEKAP